MNTCFNNALARRTFINIWFAYCSFYLCRVNLSVAQPQLISQLCLTKAQAGSIASAMLFGYAAGQLINGAICNKIGARNLIVIGLAGSGLMNLLFGFGHSLLFLTIAWGINGYFQAAGWPACVNLLKTCVPQKSRGFMTGLWGTSYQTGNILAWLIAGSIIPLGGWRPVFWIPAIMLGLAAAYLLFALRNNPDKQDPEPERSISKEKLSDTMRKVLSSRPIKIIAMAYFGLGLVRYVFLNWAITYLVEHGAGSVKSSSYKMILMPLLGIGGVLVTGYMADRMYKSLRAPVAMISFILLGVSILLFKYIPPDSIFLMAAVLGLIGFMIAGNDCLLGAVGPQDFVTNSQTAFAAGVIDCAMYLGAIASGFGAGWMIDHLGWNSVIYLCIGVSVLCAALMALLWTEETKGQKHEHIAA